MSYIKYIADENHYKEVLSLVGKAKRTVWIGTADNVEAVVHHSVRPSSFLMARNNKFQKLFVSLSPDSKTIRL